MEDATHALLTDFTDSLANLPSEIGFLLNEVAFLDYTKPPKDTSLSSASLTGSTSFTTTNASAPDLNPPTLQYGNGEQGIEKRWYSVEEARRKSATKHSSIVRHSHRPPNNLLTPNPKEAALVAKASAHYEDAIRLSVEKERMVARAHGLVMRHLNRLNQELVKLEASTGVEVPEIRKEVDSLSSVAGADQVSVQNAIGLSHLGSTGSMATPPATVDHRPKKRVTLTAPSNSSFHPPNLATLPPSHHPHATQLTLTSAYASSSPGSSTPTVPLDRHRSRLQEASAAMGGTPGSASAAGASIGAPGVAVSPGIAASGTPTGSMPPPTIPADLQRRKRPRRIVEDEDEEGEEEPEGHDGEDGEEEGDSAGEEVDASNGGDDTLYCFCQRVSYGEMIGCDGPSCKYEWFHLQCLGLKATPTGSWFCPSCRDDWREKRGGQAARGRRR